MKSKKLFAEIGEMIGKDDLEGAIKKLSTIMKQSEQLDDIIVQSARYNDVMKQIRDGVIDFQQSQVTKNQIRYALMDITREFETAVLDKPALEAEMDRAIEQAYPSSNNSSIEGNNNINIQGINSGGDTNININKS